ncbi:MAG: hypothetical protein AB8G15_04380 [Saprospiraceae bacterium]
MKTVIQIFAVYLLALSLIPCSDGGSGIVELTKHLLQIEHQHVATHQQHSNSCGDDQCAPFCVCTCCTSVVDFPVEANFLLAPLAPTPATKPSFSPQLSFTAFTAIVWQPPQLS